MTGRDTIRANMAAAFPILTVSVNEYFPKHLMFYPIKYLQKNPRQGGLLLRHQIWFTLKRKAIQQLDLEIMNLLLDSLHRDDIDPGRHCRTIPFTERQPLTGNPFDF